MRFINAISVCFKSIFANDDSLLYLDIVVTADRAHLPGLCSPVSQPIDRVCSVGKTKPVFAAMQRQHSTYVVTKIAIPDSRARHSIYQIRLRAFYGR